MLLFIFYFGFILGFSKSLYNHNIIAILKNFITQLFPIIGLEFAREIIIARNKENKPLTLYITILLILLEMNFYTITNLLANREEMFEYICSTIIPLIACNILHTYLTLKCTYIVTLIYRIFNTIVILLLPIIPNFDWFAMGSLSLLSTIIIYLLFKYKLIKENTSVKKKRKDYYAKLSYTVTLILSIFLICFMLGIFKYEPISILSNSMEPKFSACDVVIIKKLSESELKEIPIGTIIAYTVNKQNVIHRVVDIVKIDDTVFYQTKGDNNNSPDANLVQIEQIRGIYKTHIKYIGFPSVWLYYFFNSERMN